MSQESGAPADEKASSSPVDQFTSIISQRRKSPVMNRVQRSRSAHIDTSITIVSSRSSRSPPPSGAAAGLSSPTRPPPPVPAALPSPPPPSGGSSSELFFSINSDSLQSPLPPSMSSVHPFSTRSVSDSGGGGTDSPGPASPKESRKGSTVATHRRRSNTPATEDLADKIAATSARKRSSQLDVPINNMTLNELVLVLGRRGFKWKLCDLTSGIDRAIFTFELRRGFFSRTRAKTASGGGSIKPSPDEIKSLKKEPWTIKTLKDQDRIFDIPSVGDVEIIPKLPPAQKNARLLQILLDITPATGDSTDEVLKDATMLILDDNEKVLETYSLRQVDDVFSVDGDSAAFEIQLKESGVDADSKLFTKIYRVHLQDAFSVSDVLHIVQQVIDHADFASTCKSLLDSLNNDLMLFHAGTVSTDGVPSHPKYLWLVRGRLLLFKKPDSTKACGAISTTDQFAVTLGDHGESFLIMSGECRYMISTSSEVERNLWIAALVFEAQIRHAQSPFVDDKSGGTQKRKSTKGSLERRHSAENVRNIKIESKEDEKEDDIGAPLEMDFSDSLKADEAAAALKGMAARKLCNRLRKQYYFFHFAYYHLRKQKALRQTSLVQEDQFRTQSEKSIFSRGNPIMKSISDRLVSYHQFTDKAFMFLSHCLLLSKDNANTTSSNQISFSFPGFETTTFNAGNYSVIDAYKMIQNPDDPTCFTKSQWRDALKSQASVGKELMQCTCDAAELYDKGKIDLAKQLTVSTTTESLRNLFVSAYCYMHVKELSMNDLTKFTLDEMIREVDPSGRNSGRLTLLGGLTFWVNPSIDEVCKLFTQKRKYVFKKLMYICTPLHWLHLVRFVVTERFGRIRQIQNAVDTYRERDGKKWQNKGLTEFMEEFGENVEQEYKSLVNVLSQMPTVTAMIEAMKKEQSKIADFLKSGTFDSLNDLQSKLTSFDKNASGSEDEEATKPPVEFLEGDDVDFEDDDDPELAIEDS
jgi:hypothetical protein